MAEVSAHMQVPAFLIEIEGGDCRCNDEQSTAQSRGQRGNTGARVRVVQDPVNRLVSQVLALTPTKPN